MSIPVELVCRRVLSDGMHKQMKHTHTHLLKHIHTHTKHKNDGRGPATDACLAASPLLSHPHHKHTFCC